MTKTAKPLKLVEFDAARYLDDDEAVAEYMTVILDANDPDLLLLALSDAARAKGMASSQRLWVGSRESLVQADPNTVRLRLSSFEPFAPDAG